MTIWLPDKSTIPNDVMKEEIILRNNIFACFHIFMRTCLQIFKDWRAPNGFFERKEALSEFYCVLSTKWIANVMSAGLSKAVISFKAVESKLLIANRFGDRAFGET